ncbi:hypothetical protein L493_2218 [Bordetella bronchiseptica 99-R-0433]|nr:hypothetical protein L493_2218 [Bordetella bronchiseptica 99-R-0433]
MSGLLAGAVVCRPSGLERSVEKAADRNGRRTARPGAACADFAWHSAPYGAALPRHRKWRTWEDVSPTPRAPKGRLTPACATPAGPAPTAPA